MIPAQLLREVEELRKAGYTIDVLEADGYAVVIISNYSVPPAYSKPQTRVLLKFPMSFPNGRPDMFWTDVDLTLPNGIEPESANTLEDINGERWRRFSWHPQSWNSGTDNLYTYLEFVNTRFAKAR